MTQTYLAGLNRIEGYAQKQGEIDPEIWSNHSGAKKQALRVIEQLPTADQELIEAVFPLDGTELPDLEDDDTRNELAETFGVERPQELQRHIDEVLERLGEQLYPGVTFTSEAA